MFLIFSYMSADKSFHICLKLSLGMVQLGFSLRIKMDEALLKHLRSRTMEKMALALDLRHSWLAPFKLDNIIHHWHESSRCPL